MDETTMLKKRLMAARIGTAFSIITLLAAMGLLRTSIYCVYFDETSLMVDCINDSLRDKDGFLPDDIPSVYEKMDIKFGLANIISPFRWTADSFDRNDNEFYQKVKPILDKNFESFKIEYKKKKLEEDRKENSNLDNAIKKVLTKIEN
jgi:hypothetical protein